LESADSYPEGLAKVELQRRIQWDAIAFYRHACHDAHNGVLNPEKVEKEAMALWEAAFPGTKWKAGFMPLPEIWVLIGRLHKFKGDILLGFKYTVRGCLTEYSRNRKCSQQLQKLSTAFREILQSKDLRAKFAEELGLKGYHLSLLYFCYVSAAVRSAKSTCGEDSRYANALVHMAHEDDKCDFDAFEGTDSEMRKQILFARATLLEWAGVEDNTIDGFEDNFIDSVDASTSIAEASAVGSIAPSTIDSDEASTIIAETSAVDSVEASTSIAEASAAESVEANTSNAETSAADTIAPSTNDSVEAASIAETSAANSIEPNTINSVEASTSIAEASAVESVEANTSNAETSAADSVEAAEIAE
jgi:hypothetical protein